MTASSCPSSLSARHCGILLDLHNIYCNALNGRQSVEQFLSALPLERVWELHVAGGFEVDGYWLDAHSGAIPPPLHAICAYVVPSLPQLKAIVFELFCICHISAWMPPPCSSSVCTSSGRCDGRPRSARNATAVRRSRRSSQRRRI